MKDKGNPQHVSDIKDVFCSEFPEFIHAFEKLCPDENFWDMLMDYRTCQMELQKLSDLYSAKELYLQLQSELKEEIINYIINHIKS